MLEKQIAELKGYWADLMDRLALPSEESIFEEIIHLHSHESRFYHGLNHIHHLLSQIEEYQNHIIEIPALQFSAFFHDIVYDSHRSDNEAQSANFAKKTLSPLNLPEDLISKMEDIILRTQKHDGKGADSDTCLFLDLDLSILGAEPAIFMIYAENIRKEYGWVPLEMYKTERKRVLLHFLERERLYFSDLIFEKLEVQARINLQWEVDSL